MFLAMTSLVARIGGAKLMSEPPDQRIKTVLCALADGLVP